MVTGSVKRITLLRFINFESLVPKKVVLESLLKIAQLGSYLTTIFALYLLGG